MNDPLDPDAKPGENQPAKPASEDPYSSPKSEAPLPNNHPLFFPAMGNGSMSEMQEKNWASLGHLTSLLGLFTAGLGYLVGPFVVYYIKRGDSPFVDEHSKETLNFSILTTIVILGSGLLGFAGCFIWMITAAMAVLNFIYCIQGFAAARNGEAYRYPFNWRLIK